MGSTTVVKMQYLPKISVKGIDLHHDEMLALWFLLYNPDAPVEEEDPNDDVEMTDAQQQEGDVGENNENGTNNSDQVKYSLILNETNARLHEYCC